MRSTPEALDCAASLVHESSSHPPDIWNSPEHGAEDAYTARIVSSTVEPVGESAQREKVYRPLAAGVKEYQMLRDTMGWQEGAGGSPAVVAPLMSGVTDVK